MDENENGGRPKREIKVTSSQVSHLNQHGNLKGMRKGKMIEERNDE